jgi:hypothetical protein
MNIKIKPPSPIAATRVQAQAGDGARPQSAFMMAPVELTPLAPPSSAPAMPSAPAAQDRSPAAERRQAFFSGQHKALLERLNQPQQGGQGSALSAPQRAACVAVLTNIAAAADASE